LFDQGDLIKDFPLEETIPPKMAAMVAILEGNLGEAAELLSPISATDSAALLIVAGPGALGQYPVTGLWIYVEARG